MNFQTLYQKSPITLLLIASFILVFVIQLTQGVNIDNPTNKNLIDYGANFLPLTLTDDYWRLISSGFLHIGIIHLLLNSFAMYYFGQVAEIIINRGRFLALFLLSVIGGNILNLCVNWHDITRGDYPSISAGASGGIMGIGMALLIIAMSKLPIAKALNKRSLALIMTINILMGFTIPNIDNAGHIGGAMSGAVLGISFVLNKQKQSLYFIITAILLMVVFVATWYYLRGQLFTVFSLS